MSSSSSAFDGRRPQQSQSSSSRPPPEQHHSDHETDVEPIVPRGREGISQGSEAALGDGISFKRKQKASAGFSYSNFFSAFSDPSPSSSAPIDSPRRRDDSPLAPLGHERNGPHDNGFANGSSHGHGGKEGGPLDWYVEGPGRRVGYDDMTAIDWIFEYTKERQRLRVLYSSATGILGHVQKLADASYIWLVLIGTGVAAGVLAAGIDVASDWLGDLKAGFCRNGPGGGKFYLNRAFCCWGHEEWSQCQDWTPWRTAFHVSSSGGGFVIEYIIFVCLSILFATCASVLVGAFAPYAKQSGIPEIKTVLGGFVIRRFMGAWTLVVKSVGLCLAVASGLWLGKEGPLVHVACCCANLLMKLYGTLSGNEARKREVLSAAAAAGISVAFGSPIGGVLFSLEQLSYYFPDKTMWQSFVCAMMAAVTLQGFNPFRTGKLVLYQVTYSSGWHGFELIPFVILGVLGGLYGGLFIKLNMKISSWRKSSRLFKSSVREVMVVALVTAVINFPNVFMRAQSSELVYSLFAECSAIPDDQFGLCKTGAATAGTIVLLLSASILGFFLASVTFGLDIPAGIILPSMAIGALYGRALGLIVETWQSRHPNLMIFGACEPDIPCVTPGTYAIIGAASALGGVTRMTVSIVVIMFELTGALTYVLPIMIAVMISKWVGDVFGKRGIYESWIHFNEYPLLDQRDESAIPDVPVAHIMTRIEDLVVLPARGHSIASLQQLLRTHPFRGFPVISDTREALLLGYVSRTELLYALDRALSPPQTLPADTETHFARPPEDADSSATTLDLRPWIDQTPLMVSSKSSLQLTANLFQKLGLRYVLFCDRGVLQGILTKKDVWYVLNGAEERTVGGGIGALRERGEGVGEERGLLGEGEGVETPILGR
ncbi:MAG: hypothetical protein M1817_001325 [Caeruleum heppii]|nr:MAG: hypothetical protein M1817_001325 [Caeruleum heppii]